MARSNTITTLKLQTRKKLRKGIEKPVVDTPPSRLANPEVLFSSIACNRRRIVESVESVKIGQVQNFRRL